MRAVFADSSYYVALLNPSDQNHDAARRLSQECRSRVVLSEHILLELGSALSRGTDRRLFLGLVRRLSADPMTRIVRASRGLFERGLSLFARRPDKEWSLVDCISFEIMRKSRIADALTTDHHFEQAGFNALLRKNP